MTIEKALLPISLAIVFGTTLLLSWPAAGADKPLSIQNEFLQVTYEPACGKCGIVTRPSGERFVTDCTLAEARGTARVGAVNDKTFGDGQAIEITYASGANDALQLFPKLPFVLFRATLRNPEADVKVLNRVRLVSAGLDLGKPVEELKSMGTGGLLALDKNPGSYAWQAIADPSTRSGVVGGWLTHDRGSGVVFTPVADGMPRMEARVEYGRLRIAAGKATESETFALGHFDDARVGLEAWADAVAKVYRIKLPRQPVGYCTWYSDKHAGACDEVHLAELAEFAAKQLKPFGFDFIQIDDNWQAGVSKNGPKRNFTAVAEKGPYPSGMQPTAENLKKQGLVPGIWFMPFAGTFYDPFFKDHQDWFVKRENGEPYETDWGGTCLDMTQAGAREHLRGLVQRLAHEWGYTFFKMDGLWTGTATKQIYVNTGYRDDGIGDAVFANPEKTNIEAYRDGLKLVRQTAGDRVFLLGCCASQNLRSYGGAFGLLDAMRIGPDTGGHLGGATYGARQYFLHGRVWYNDPDCVGVRASVPLDQARMWASWVAISSQLYYDSDWLPDLPPERLDILRRTMLPHGQTARPVDYFDNDQPRIWLVTDERGTPRREVAALFNWSGKPAEFDCPLATLGLDDKTTYVGFNFWGNAFLAPFQGRLQATLPKGSCQILSLRSLLDRPLLISTSRHVTQGIVDVSEEKWDEATSTLSGRSHVVADDPYELRVVAVGKNRNWAAAGVDVSAADQAAGVRVTHQQTNGLIRVQLAATASREVAWTIRFRSGPAAATAPAAVNELRATAEMSCPVTLTWSGSDGVCYEIVRTPGATTTVTSGRFADEAIEPGKEYRYRVTAIDWNGARSEPREVAAKTPQMPPLPPKPDVSLMTLKPQQASVGWGKLGVGQAVSGKPLRIGDKTYQDGVGVHAVSRLVYARQPEFKRFVAVAGLDEGIRENGRSSLVCKVVADCGAGEQKTLAASPVLVFGRCERWHFDVELPADCKKILLIVDDGGDGVNSDHADWVDAGFITGGK